MHKTPTGFELPLELTKEVLPEYGPSLTSLRYGR
jgi:hypothetical protein